MTNYQLQIKSFVFGPFETNCYVVSDEQQILLVDPACSSLYEQQMLLRYINSLHFREGQGLGLQILATHGHLDHLWGAAWACAKWNTPVLMHEADIPMAKAMQSQYDLFGIRAKAQPFPIEPISNDQLPGASSRQTGGVASAEKGYCQSPIPPFRREQGGRILHTPGHTPGSICLYFPKSPITNNQSPGASSRLTGGAASAEEGFPPITNNQSPITNYQSPILFSGDTLFKMGYGRTDLPGGNFSQLMNSLDLLFALPSDVQVFPGHGEPTTIAAERRFIL